MAETATDAGSAAKTAAAASVVHESGAVGADEIENARGTDFEWGGMFCDQDHDDVPECFKSLLPYPCQSPTRKIDAYNFAQRIQKAAVTLASLLGGRSGSAFSVQRTKRIRRFSLSHRSQTRQPRARIRIPDEWRLLGPKNELMSARFSTVVAREGHGEGFAANHRQLPEEILWFDERSARTPWQSRHSEKSCKATASSASRCTWQLMAWSIAKSCINATLDGAMEGGGEGGAYGE